MDLPQIASIAVGPAAFAIGMQIGYWRTLKHGPNRLFAYTVLGTLAALWIAIVLYMAFGI